MVKPQHQETVPQSEPTVAPTETPTPIEPTEELEPTAVPEEVEEARTKSGGKGQTEDNPSEMPSLPPPALGTKGVPGQPGDSLLDGDDLNGDAPSDDDPNDDDPDKENGGNPHEGMVVPGNPPGDGQTPEGGAEPPGQTDNPGNGGDNNSGGNSDNNGNGGGKKDD